MKKLIFCLCLSLPIFGQSISLSIPLKTIGHPKKAWKSSSGSNKFMFISFALLQAANVGDAYTTYRGVVVGNDCESNPLFQTAPCSKHNLNVGKFDTAKALIAGSAVLEYVPTWISPKSKNYYLFLGLVNLAPAAVLGAVDVHNTIVLSK